MKKYVWFFFGLLLLSCSCFKKKDKENVKETTENHIQNAKALAPVIIYKTKKNYNNLVPVILSDDHKKIVSYPNPSDLLTNGNFAIPTELDKGYLLDNRGINKNVAFINMSYEAYSKLKKPLSLQEMFTLIVDKEPLLEIYYCGKISMYKNLISDLNKLINQNSLSKCKKLVN